MCRPLELGFGGGAELGEQVGPKTPSIKELTTFEKFYDAYKAQMNYMIGMMVNADNSIDLAHAERCPLPFLSSMVDDCIARGKVMHAGGVRYYDYGSTPIGMPDSRKAPGPIPI
jgi:formate C-acetyltransferase